MNNLFGESSWLPLDSLVASGWKTGKINEYIDRATLLVVRKPACVVWECTYSAAISASCSAALTAASSSSLDKGLLPFLSLAYHVRSLPFCHLPTGAIKEFPGNTAEELILFNLQFMYYSYLITPLSLTVFYKQ